MIQPRDYQQNAHDAVIEWVKRSTEPCVVEAPTGAGKSVIIAMLASTLTNISKGKHVLCLAPRAELVVQNREKYLATGEPASVYSASAGQKCLKHPVVFATPGTFKGKARAIGGKFCAVVLDEAHGITPTVRQIIEDMRVSNPNLRIIGLSATPYRLGTGYIYQTDETGRAYGPDKALDPYFAARVFTISARVARTWVSHAAKDRPDQCGKLRNAAPGAEQARASLMLAMLTAHLSAMGARPP